MLDVRDIDEHSRIYNSACDHLRQNVREVGAEYIDTRGCLNPMTCSEYMASPYDWHFSAKANERVGKAVATALEGSSVDAQK